jgi:HAD superfamily hydrolase (TIGR01549 family)
MLLNTILLDLDDTLLDSNTKQFATTYVKKLAQALAGFASTETISSLILRATAIMRANQDPAITNLQAFKDAFFPHLSGSPAEIQVALDHFYQEIYPTLRNYVTPRPEARPLVDHLLATGHKVVIATNPLYPRTAIEQRLGWAGVSEFPYALVTNMENMHFCKPSPHYYQEILDIVGSTSTEALMVGDNPKNDIAPARAIGLQTWWITDQASPDVEVISDYQGSLTEFYRWIQEDAQASASAS